MGVGSTSELIEKLYQQLRFAIDQVAKDTDEMYF